MNDMQIERLLDALESIGSSLSEISVSLENIDDSFGNCIYSDANGSMFRVTGNVYTN